jgi:hypothetical protein
MLRKLRIAVSAVCGILCLLLIALWVRSYWWMDRVDFTTRPTFVSTPVRYCESVGGMLQLTCDFPFDELSWVSNLDYAAYTIEDWYGGLDIDVTTNFTFSKEYISIGVPHWWVLTFTLAAAIIPWLHWRFSLRALLFTVTVTGVILGAIAYLMR